MERRTGWTIVEDTMRGYEITWRTGEAHETMPMILEDEEDVWKEIADNMIEQLQQFIDGDRELADTAFETMEIPAEIEIDENGDMMVWLERSNDPVVIDMNIQEWRESL